MSDRIVRTAQHPSVCKSACTLCTLLALSLSLQLPWHVRHSCHLWQPMVSSGTQLPTLHRPCPSQIIYAVLMKRPYSANLWHTHLWHVKWREQQVTIFKLFPDPMAWDPSDPQYTCLEWFRSTIYHGSPWNERINKAIWVWRDPR